MSIDKKFWKNVKDGFEFLRERDDDAVYIVYRSGDEKYIDFIMKKRCWYYGSYPCFSGSIFTCSFEVRFLEDLLKEKKDGQK